jgi:hypothetical protein
MVGANHLLHMQWQQPNKGDKFFFFNHRLCNFFCWFLENGVGKFVKVWLMSIFDIKLKIRVHLFFS